MNLPIPSVNGLVSFKRDQILDSTQKIRVHNNIGTLSLVQTQLQGYIPYTGATQSLDMGLYDVQATRFKFGSTGPQLDNSGGTIRARTNNGLADAPISAGSGTFSANVTVGAFPAISTGPINVKSDGKGDCLVLANSATEYTRFVSGGIYKGLLGQGSVPLVLSSSNVRLMSDSTIAFRNVADTADASMSCANVTANGTSNFGSPVGVKLASAVTNTTLLEVNPNKVLLQGDIFKVWGYQSSFFTLAQTHVTGPGLGLTSPTLKMCGTWNESGTTYTPTFTMTMNPTAYSSGYTNFAIDGYECMRLAKVDGNRPGLVQINSPTITEAQLNVTPSWDNKKGIVVRASSPTQAYNLFETQSSTGTTEVSIAPGGKVTTNRSTQASYGVYACGKNSNGYVDWELNEGLAAGYGGSLTLRAGDAANTGYLRLRYDAGYPKIEATGGITFTGGGRIRMGGTYIDMGAGSDATNWLYLNGITNLSRATNGFESRNADNTAYAPIKFGFISLSADPTTLDLVLGGVSVYKNTTSGTLKLWANDGGTMKSVALT